MYRVYSFDKRCQRKFVFFHAGPLYGLAIDVIYEHIFFLLREKTKVNL